MTPRTSAPSNHDRGRRHGPFDDPTFWRVFNEHTDPLDVEPEQSKRGERSVYFLHYPTLRQVKIGVTTNIKRRRQVLSNGEPCVLLGLLDGGYVLERLMHQRFAAYRIKGEWFSDAIIEEAETLIRADREFFSR